MSLRLCHVPLIALTLLVGCGDNAEQPDSGQSEDAANTSSATTKNSNEDKEANPGNSGKKKIASTEGDGQSRPRKKEVPEKIEPPSWEDLNAMEQDSLLMLTMIGDGKVNLPPTFFANKDEKIIDAIWDLTKQSAIEEVQTVIALGVVEKESDAAKGLNHLLEAANRKEVPYASVFLATTLLRQGLGGQKELKRYADLGSSPDLQGFVHALLAATCRGNIQTLIALDVLSSDDARTKGLFRLADDVAAGTVRARNVGLILEAIRNGAASAKLNALLVDYAAASETDRRTKTDEILNEVRKSLNIPGDIEF